MSKRVRESLDLGSTAKIINVPTPSSSGDAVNKAYVDALPSALSFIEKPARLASTVNINVASPGANIDSTAANNGDRILLTGQTTASQNGLYVYNGSATPMTRTTDTFITGAVVFSTGDGATNGNIGWILTTDGTITVGTTSMTWIAAFRVIAVGTGLQMSGNVVSLTSPVTIALGGTNATTAAAALASLGAAIPNNTLFGNGSSTSFTFSTFKSIVPYPVVRVYNASTGAEEDASVTITPGSASGGVYTPSIVVTSEDWVASPPASSAYYVTVVG